MVVLFNFEGLFDVSPRPALYMDGGMFEKDKKSI